ncbi:MAG TPA: nuclear transport factor 2 family protein [Ktedonobacterales bacterium]|jgi:ketosteroid isomerase-like protein|nr:nuclear transport factor 2 family protein [Ktedonobacterales bacterium]
MLTRATVAAWLDAYTQAWRSYDPAAIGDLFSADATYYYSPYSEPVHGRAAIVASWLKEPDAPPGSYSGSYTPLALDGDLAVANGRSRYFEADGTTLKDEFDNLFVLRFDADGRCSEFREWYMRQPKPSA